MLKHTKFRPYVRRLNGHEVAHDLETSIKLSFLRKQIKAKRLKKAYVLTQRGFSNHVMAVSVNKRDLQCSSAKTSKHFKSWSLQIQKQAFGSSKEHALIKLPIQG
ncbi:hypothetical protein [Litoribacillus peritrichatus]|uniref:Uncharacterized protein n=1 Tax=Litoribacillus peritrichatus TaxID=718191 RepID=A0ABP7M2F0_9GAMM